MKKTLLTAALVAGFASAAHAETSVTLYGVVDGGVGYTSVKTNYDASDYVNNGAWVGSVSGTVKDRGFGVKSGVQSGNRWGLMGTEDLGNGTSAIFQLESGFNLGNGEHLQEGRLFGRKAILGLTGESWGTLTLGRQYNVGDDFLAPIDPFGTGFGQAAVTKTAGTSWSGRYDSAVKYLSPNFSGFQVGLAWAGTNNKEDSDVTWTQPGNNWQSESETHKQNDNMFSLGLAYNNGPIQAALVWDHQNQKDRNSWTYADSNGNYNSGSTTDKSTVDAWNLGFAYDFDVVKLHLGVGQQRDGVIRDSDDSSNLWDNDNDVAWGMGAVDYRLNGVDNFFGDGYKQTHWLVGLSAPVGEAGKVLFSYQGAHGKNSNSGVNNYGNNFTTAYDWSGKTRTNIFSLGYTHSLSKRTNIYALASYGVTKFTANGAEYGNNWYDNSDARVKTKSTQINVGLRHRF
ncbi:MAG: porin [Alcaligenaceae bacterium]|jgi:predicted porin|nr:porin [Alcaligenaceae bacterium]